MYSFDSRVRYSETDSGGFMSLASVLDYFQDCSTFHSEDIGLGIKNLKRQRRIWVLSAWQIVAERYPEFGERIKVVTFPYEFKGFMGYRNFYIEDAKGMKTAYANSIWSLMDLDTMKPVKVTEEMSGGYLISERLPMEYAPRKIAVPDTGVRQESFQVQSHHLDTNQHVNNGQYLRMALDYLPEGMTITQMRAEYKTPAMLHDAVIPIVACQNGTYIISLCQEAGNPYAVIELRGK